MLMHFHCIKFPLLTNMNVKWRKSTWIVVLWNTWVMAMAVRIRYKWIACITYLNCIEWFCGDLIKWKVISLFSIYVTGLLSCKIPIAVVAVGWYWLTNCILTNYRLLYFPRSIFSNLSCIDVVVVIDQLKQCSSRVPFGDWVTQE